MPPPGVGWKTWLIGGSVVPVSFHGLSCCEQQGWKITELPTTEAGPSKPGVFLIWLCFAHVASKRGQPQTEIHLGMTSTKAW